jgi:hypothetical protein
MLWVHLVFHCSGTSHLQEAAWLPSGHIADVGTQAGVLLGTLCWVLAASSDG